MVDKNYCCDISAVMITYNPEMDALYAAIDAVSSQVSDLFIVDNGSSNGSLEWINELKNQTIANLHLLYQEDNLGIGAAHNIGIRHAIKQSSTFVLLLDQDSQIGSDMVVKLRTAYAKLNAEGLPIAAIGPQYRDADKGVLSQFVKVGLFRFIHCGGTENNVPIDTDFLVSSGSLISISALENVGLMDESLFIDHVDTEWCFRAKANGLKIFGLCGAVMTHALGEQRREVWFLRKRSVPFHKPFRYYYMFRNSILLYRRRYMPWGWKLADMSRCVKMLVFFACVGEQRLTFLKMICLGVLDGLKGVTGKRANL